LIKKSENEVRKITEFAAFEINFKKISTAH